MLNHFSIPIQVSSSLSWAESTMAANTGFSRMAGNVKGTATVNSTELLAPSTSNPKPAAVTHLSKPDLDAFREAIGAPPIFYEEADPRNPTATSKLSRKIPSGLYKTVLDMQKRASIRYFFITLLFNCSILLQLLLGATLTALSAVGSVNADKIGISTTVIAAVNTVVAGLIALFHNAGFPGRLRSDLNEYAKVVEWLEFVMHSGVVDVGMTRDDVIQAAYDRYNTARATVERNQPEYYAGGSSPKDASPDLSL